MGQRGSGSDHFGCGALDERLERGAGKADVGSPQLLLHQLRDLLLSHAIEDARSGARAQERHALVAQQLGPTITVVVDDTLSTELGQRISVLGPRGHDSAHAALAEELHQERRHAAGRARNQHGLVRGRARRRRAPTRRPRGANTGGDVQAEPVESGGCPKRQQRKLCRLIETHVRRLVKAERRLSADNRVAQPRPVQQRDDLASVGGESCDPDQCGLASWRDEGVALEQHRTPAARRLVEHRTCTNHNQRVNRNQNHAHDSPRRSSVLFKSTAHSPTLAECQAFTFTCVRSTSAPSAAAKAKGSISSARKE
eukprot:3746819-Prymnesium_polylepis.1